MTHLFRAFIAACVLLTPLWAQDAPRDISLDVAVNRPFVFSPRAMNGLQWLPDGQSFSHLAGGSAGPRIVVEDVATKKTRIALDAATWKTMLEEAELEPLGAQLLGRATWTSQTTLELMARGRRLSIDLDQKKVSAERVYPARAEAHAFGDDKAVVAWVQDKDVYVRKRNGKVHRVTSGGFKHLTHGLAVSRVEFGIVDGLWWDASGRRLAFYREDLRTTNEHELIDWSVRPAVEVGDRYPMAGTPNSVVHVGVYDLRRDATLWLETDPKSDEYLTNVTWTPDGREVWIAHVARSQDHMRLVRYDATTGKALGVLFEEKDDEWTEPQDRPIFVPDGSGDFLWFTPKNGFRHLHRHRSDGGYVGPVTKGTFDVRSFEGFDEHGGLYFTSSGPDARQMHLWHTSAKSDPDAKAQQLTQGRGRHSVLIAKKTGALLDRHSNLKLPLAIDLVDAKGRPMRRLHELPSPFENWRTGDESFFETKSKDGSTLYGHMITPPNMDRSKKHPVLLYVYGGPHSQLITDTWMGGARSLGVWFHHMASKGYVVVRIDGHGTQNRGIDFVQAIHRQLGTIEIEDQLAGLDHVLGLGFADPDRVGVHGWSYGGFMTLSLMTRAGDRFAAGVAGAPVTDWAYYETGYGERYMDTPEENPKGYAMADPGRHVKGIKGRLLVVQGSSDITVVWQHTIDFIEKCIQANVDVDYFVYPGQAHGLRGAHRRHFYGKMTTFFDRVLKP